MRLASRSSALVLIAALAATLPPGAAAQHADAAVPALLPGDPAVDATRLPLGTDTTRLFFLQGGEERAGPLQIEELSVVEAPEGRFLRQVLAVESPRGRMVDTTDFRLPGLEPLRHRSRGAAMGVRDMVLDYGPGARVSGRVEHPDSGTIPLEHAPLHPVFDPGASHLLVQALSLTPGYARRVPFFNHEARDVRWTTFEVLEPGAPGAEDAPDGVWVVRQRLHDGRDVFLWLRRGDRRIVEVRAPLPGGLEMRGRSTAGGHRR